MINHFKRKDKRCSSCGAKIRLREEKESDIGIVTRVIELASEDQADLFLVISGDTDLRPGLVLFRKLFPNKQLRILFPPKRRNHSITEAAGGRQHVRQIEEHHLLLSQLPHVVRDSGGRVLARRPARYHSISSSLGPAAAASLHLFGAATPTGEAFRQLAISADPARLLHAYSRQSPVFTDRADFTNPEAFRPAGEPGTPAIWITFGPIWLLAPFLEQLARHHPERLAGLRGLIACSSSSAITKRFAANRFDRELVARLTRAEDQLLATCRRLDVPCRILRPTLIYGQAGAYGDRNLSRLLALLRRLPLVPLPAHTGLRQPIHARQLAAVALHLAQQLGGSGWDGSLPSCIALGGDTTLSYAAMVSALQQAQPPGDPARRCRLLRIPNPLFFALASPLLLRSPKAFEAVLRMGANLSGFTPAHQLLGSTPQPFPVLPLA